MDIESKTRAFCNAWQSISIIYEDYARKCGISYNSLYILNAILYTDNCTQKLICDKTLLPKQTVNNVITSFFKNGYIELKEIPENRRIKTIYLTQKGMQYAMNFIPHIHKADCKAMEALTEEQQDTLLKLIDIYASTFRKEMLGE
ncbi:MarR family winged helix-turn-helix transcriptional regulator [Ruminococcus sp.]|uniref:MarR family winged helix-turn-helix transcriptional regulator n=1 Tax=Ruminococcus sp. TaxID=41978 RepID=UPI00386E2C3B